MNTLSNLEVSLEEKLELWLLGQFVSHPLLAAAQPIHGWRAGDLVHYIWREFEIKPFPGDIPVELRGRRAPAAPAEIIPFFIRGNYP